MLFMVISSAVCILMCLCEMFYLIGKRVARLVKICGEIEKILSAEQHELAHMVAPRSQDPKTDPTLTDSQLSSEGKVREGVVTTTL